MWAYALIGSGSLGFVLDLTLVGKIQLLVRPTKRKLSSGISGSKGFGASPACVCGSGHTFAACCGRLADPAVRCKVSRPSIIVRSRYSAYARGDHEYIMDTTHELNSVYQSNRGAWRASLAAQPIKEYRFLGVDILEEDVDRDEACVIFVAKLMHKVSKQRADFKERSNFRRSEDAGWLYVGGDVMRAPLVD